MPLRVLAGNFCLLTRRFVQAAREYAFAAARRPADPLPSLLLGVVFVNMAAQRMSAWRNRVHLHVIQARVVVGCRQ